MRRSFLYFLAGLSALMVLSSGCSDPFAAPTRVKPPPKASDTVGSKPDFFVFVVPGAPVGKVEIWAMRAQHEANDKRTVFRIMGPAPTDSADAEPTVVRRAVAEGATGLLVYPSDSPDLPKALAEAEAKGVAVVLMGKSIAAPEGSKPFTVVDLAPFEDTAKKIVAATIEDLKAASQPTNGTAIVLADKTADDTSSLRVAALKAAAEAAKFRQVVTVPFDGSSDETAKQAVLEAVKANPDVSIVLADHVEGMAGASLARGELKGKPVFFVGGYTDYKASRILVPPQRESCFVEGRFIEVGAQAVLTAIAKRQGKTVGERVYVTPKFTKTEGGVASETDANPISQPLKPQPILKERREDARKDLPDKPQ